MEQQFNSNNNMFGESNQPQDLKSLLTSDKFRCCGFKQAKYVCAQKTCKKPGFSCLDSECQCQKVHSNCKVIQFKRVINSLIRKNKPMPEQFKQSYKLLQSKINDMIEQLSDLRTRYELQQQYFGLLKEDAEFMKYVKQGRPQQICGSVISNMELNMEAQMEFYMESKDDIMKSFERKRVAFTKLIQSIESRYTYRDKKFRNKIFLDEKKRKIFQDNEVTRENAKGLLPFEFFPITVNKKLAPFANNFKLVNQLDGERFDKFQSDSNWKQAVSNQELPKEGQFFFEIFCHREVNKEAMIGILTQNCLNAQTSYANRQAMAYYIYSGQVWQNGSNSTQLGRILHNNRGLITVMLDMDEKQIHWCLDNEYQGKFSINPQIHENNKRIYAFVDVYRTNSSWQFIDENNETRKEEMMKK